MNQSPNMPLTVGVFHSAAWFSYMTMIIKGNFVRTCRFEYSSAIPLLSGEWGAFLWAISESVCWKLRLLTGRESLIRSENDRAGAWGDSEADAFETGARVCPEVPTSSSVLRDMVFPRSFVTVFRSQSKLAVNESSVYDGMYLLIRLSNRCRTARHLVLY